MSHPTKEMILEKYNFSIDCIDNAYVLGLNGQLNEAMSKISLAGLAVYQSLEWFIKNYLYDKILPTHPDFSIIEQPSFYDKMNLFVAHCHPPLDSSFINVDLIKSSKKAVRNETEHSGLIPHFNSLKKVILETHKLFSIYAPEISSSLQTFPENHNLKLPEMENWNSFFTKVDEFEKERNYILITDHNLQQYKEVLRPIGLIDWNIIIDFDENSVEKGLFNYTESELKKRRVIHKYLLTDQMLSLNSDIGTYWFFANGISGRANTSFSTFREWNRSYSTSLERLIAKIHLELAERPTTVVFLIDSSKYCYELVRLFYNNFGESVKFIYADKAFSFSGEIFEDYEGQSIEISIPQISDGILQIRNFINDEASEAVFSLPHKDNGYVEILLEDFLWLEEDLTLVHRNIIDNKIVDYDLNKQTNYYKGGPLDWEGLHFNFDIKREIYPELKQKVEKKIKDRIGSKFYIFHYPGVGGTTLAKRLAWDTHKSYPVAILKKFKKSDTINRIYKLFQLTSIPPLIILDSSKIDEQDFDILYKELLQKTFPCVFINISRSTNPANLPVKDYVYLSEVLSNKELETFINIFSQHAPERKGLLKEILATSENKKKHPFYLGLVAFEQDFENLSTFIRKALGDATLIEKKILSIIALCDIYSHRAISAQIFTGLLGLPESSVIKLEKILQPEQVYLLTNERSIEWWTLHYLIAKQILLEIFGLGNNEQLVKSSLAGLSIDLITLISERSTLPSQDELDILDQLFIIRSIDKDVLGGEEGHFSKLITEGILDDNSRLMILEKLTESFPNYSHFWSHLARFYNFKIRDFEKALYAITKAIEIEEYYGDTDSTLYHIKGMILRSRMRRVIIKNEAELSQEGLNTELVNLFEEASEAFEKSRELNGRDEYGYISDIEMIVSFLDYKYKRSGLSDRGEFLSRLGVYDLQILEKAEELLENIRSIKIGETESFYISRCDNSIQEFYTDYNTIIQNWNSLLDKSKGFPRDTVRRQLVRAYINRANGWDFLNVKDAEKIIGLAEDNISENPNNVKNISLWFKAARKIDRITIGDALEKVARWRMLKQTLESNYYLTCLHVLLAIQGNSISKIKAEELLKETSELSRTNIYRSFCLNWFGAGKNLKALLPSSEVKKDANNDIIFVPELFHRLNGKIKEIRGPEAGQLELECGLRVYFTPARAFKGDGAVRDRHLNESISFYLGFSYDGLRGYDVQKLTS